VSAISKTDVVVGIDGSVTSTAAAVWAAGEADRRRSRLVLLYSYVLYAYGSKDAALPGSVPYEEAEIAADQLLSEATDAVRAVYPKIQIEVLQQHEAAATALLEVTGEAALTVIASQAKHQAVETLIGSVATYTAEQSQGPVVVLRGNAAAAPATGPVVVGVDGSSESEPAIDFAFEAAQQRGVPLHAVHAWKSGPVQGFRRTFHLNVDHDAADTDQKGELTAALAGRSERYPDVTAEPVVLQGHPLSVLLDYAAKQGASLLVVGARGVGDMLEQALGSTSRGLLARADVPVAVVRQLDAG
jgi:nucleotide-binding universal stress UspA family protein